MRKLILLLFVFQSVHAQVLVERTLKLSPLKKEEMHFGFDRGDEIHFELFETNGKDMGEVKWQVYAGQEVYSELKVAEINKSITIHQKGVYSFVLNNNTLQKREVKLKIVRNGSEGFNTQVKWINGTDTTWKFVQKDGIIRYDTTYKEVTKRDLVKEEMVEDMLLNKSQRIKAKANFKDKSSLIAIELNKDIDFAFEEQKLVSWVYWVGVNEAGNKAWEQNSNILSKVVKTGASMVMSPLGALAVGIVADLAIPTMGEDVEYYLVDAENALLYQEGKDYKYIDKGKGAAGFKKLNAEKRRKFYLILKNDNLLQSIDVNVKVSAIYQKKTYEEKRVKEPLVVPVQGKITEKVPVVKNSKVPVVQS